MKHSRNQAFTLIELLTVVAIVIILMGLIISTAGYVQDKASRDRANAEIKALEVAMESYKADNGIYPMGTASNALKRVSGSYPKTPNQAYKDASAELYAALSGDTNGDYVRTNAEKDSTVYFEFQTKKNMLQKLTGTPARILIMDPWGNSYGYSTAVAASSPPDYTIGYNPTFDLWSTANKTDGQTQKWVTNW